MTRNNGRGFWWTAGVVIAALMLITFVLARCDIKHMKWKTTPPIISPLPPVVTPLPVPVPTQLPHHDDLSPNQDLPNAEVTPTEPNQDLPEEGIVEVIPDATQDKEGVIVDDGTIDSRLTDPHALAQDDDLAQGDEGVEKTLGVRPFAALTKLYPNKAIAGNYPVNTVIAYGSRYFGTPYQYGSDRNTDKTFDCSDFTRWSWWKSVGMQIPADSRSQSEYVTKFGSRKYTNIRSAQRGDLLFFMSYKGVSKSAYPANKSGQTITHVGIYLGNGRMMHTASVASGGVRIDEVFNKHYEWRFIRGGSVI